MTNRVDFLSAEQARQLVEVAERARDEIARFAEQNVEYNAPALQLLDEWIDRTPNPGASLRVLWTAFLGEMFRRRHGGEWITYEDDGKKLAVLCPTDTGGVTRVEVAAQVTQRINNGMVDSLALFYLMESALLHRPDEL